VKNLILLISLIVFEIGSILSAQSTIRGEIKDTVGNPIPYIQVLLKQDDKIVNGAYTDDLGDYKIFGVKPGFYDITVGGTYTCPNTHTIKDIYVQNAEVKFVDILFNCSSDLEENVRQYVPPIFLRDTIDDRGIKNDRVRLKKNNNKVGIRPYKYSYDGLGGNFFAGTGFFLGNISKHIWNPFYFGVNLDFIHRNMVFQFDDYLGFSIAKKTMEFSDDKEWTKNKAAFNLMFGLNFGYIVLDSRAIRIVPIVGVGFEWIMAQGYSPFIPYYKIGCFMDLKFLKIGKNHPSFNIDEDNYTCVRLSFGINPHIVTPKYKSYFKGAMIYITIGMGGSVER
jgi:hypothetical protein